MSHLWLNLCQKPSFCWIKYHWICELSRFRGTLVELLHIYLRSQYSNCRRWKIYWTLLCGERWNSHHLSSVVKLLHLLSIVNTIEFLNCLFSGERLSNYYIYTYVPSNATWNDYDTDPGELFYYHDGISPLQITIASQKNIQAQYVKIVEIDPLPSSAGKALSFCEVEIYTTGMKGNTRQSRYYGFIATTRWLIVTECLYHTWPRISSTCRKHFPVLSSFMTYHRFVTRITRREPLSFQSTRVHPRFLVGFVLLDL